MGNVNILQAEILRNRHIAFHWGKSPCFIQRITVFAFIQGGAGYHLTNLQYGRVQTGIPTIFPRVTLCSQLVDIIMQEQRRHIQMTYVSTGEASRHSLCRQPFPIQDIKIFSIYGTWQALLAIASFNAARFLWLGLNMCAEGTSFS